jgi:hypothetical protein
MMTLDAGLLTAVLVKYADNLVKVFAASGSIVVSGLSAICCLLSAVCCLLSGVCCLVSAGCCLLSRL